MYRSYTLKWEIPITRIQIPSIPIRFQVSAFAWDPSRYKVFPPATVYLCCINVILWISIPSPDQIPFSLNGWRYNCARQYACKKIKKLRVSKRLFEFNNFTSLELKFITNLNTGDGYCNYTKDYQMVIDKVFQLWETALRGKKEDNSLW